MFNVLVFENEEGSSKHLKNSFNLDTNKKKKREPRNDKFNHYKIGNDGKLEACQELIDKNSAEFWPQHMKEIISSRNNKSNPNMNNINNINSNLPNNSIPRRENENVKENKMNENINVRSSPPEKLKINISESDANFEGHNQNTNHFPCNLPVNTYHQLETRLSSPPHIDRNFPSFHYHQVNFHQNMNPNMNSNTNNNHCNGYVNNFNNNNNDLYNTSNNVNNNMNNNLINNNQTNVQSNNSKNINISTPINQSLNLPQFNQINFQNKQQNLQPDMHVNINQNNSAINYNFFSSMDNPSPPKSKMDISYLLN